MNEIQSWLTQIKQWYQPQQGRDINILINAVSNAPDSIFGAIETEKHSEALAYWIDSCQRLCCYYQDIAEPAAKPEKAFGYLQFAYAKLQEMACNPELDPGMKRWSLKRLDRMIVAMAEFCQRQEDTKWQQESTQLIELHVAFMQAQNNQNLSYSIAPDSC